MWHHTDQRGKRKRKNDVKNLLETAEEVIDFLACQFVCTLQKFILYLSWLVTGIKCKNRILRFS